VGVNQGKKQIISFRAIPGRALDPINGGNTTKKTSGFLGKTSSATISTGTRASRQRQTDSGSSFTLSKMPLTDNFTQRNPPFRGNGVIFWEWGRWGRGGSDGRSSSSAEKNGNNTHLGGIPSGSIKTGTPVGRCPNGPENGVRDLISSRGSGDKKS